MSIYSEARATLMASLVSSGPNTIHPEALASLISALTDAVFNTMLADEAGIASKAPLASPSLTGTPTAPTASAGTNTTQIATTAFVSAALAALVNSAPGILDTLGEIATQLQSDESVASALATTVGGKLAKASNLSDLANADTALTNLGLTNYGKAIATAASYAAIVSALSLQNAIKSDVSSTLTAGMKTTVYTSIGTITSGTVTPALANGNLQSYTNNGAHTLAAPADDGGLVLRVTNGASAGSITFSGFTAGANTGDSLTTTNTSKFDIHVLRAGGVATYWIKALQ